MFREKLRIRLMFFEKSSEIWPKRPVRIVVWVEGEIREYERGKKAESNAKRYPLCETSGFRLHGTRRFTPVGRCPTPRRTQNLCSGTMDKSSAARFFKLLMGRQLSAAPPLFPVVHSLPPAPCPAPEYGRYWPLAVSSFLFPHGLCGSRCRTYFFSASSLAYSVFSALMVAAS